MGADPVTKRPTAPGKNLERNLIKRIRSARKSKKRIQSKKLVCELDARRAAERWFADHLFLRADDILITAFQKKTKKNEVV